MEQEEVPAHADGFCGIADRCGRHGDIARGGRPGVLIEASVLGRFERCIDEFLLERLMEGLYVRLGDRLVYRLERRDLHEILRALSLPDLCGRLRN